MASTRPSNTGATTGANTGASTAASTAGRKATTPPKGRPTRARNAARRSRAFSPTLQWVTFAFVLLVALLLLFMLTGWADFNPFGDNTNP